MITRKYDSLKDHVYKYIASRIQNGTLLPNHKINEAEICEKLEVSRTPVREALIQLSSDNLLEYIPRRGFLVKELNTKEKLDVFAVIGSLDALAARLSMEFITDSDMSMMEEYIRKIDVSIQENNYDDYQKYQTAFHKVYIDKCNNHTLITMMESLQNSFIRQSYLSNDSEKLYVILKQMNDQHKQILRYFKERDSDALANLIQFHHWKIEHPEMI
ncbi:GntR family transcriptional regulator [Brevibacillus sp. M2.1A]|uniref:Probable transcriptional regulator n=1 Tax=Brevibacillus brevis (strain 47 / JCM 6285 / NBRC 100599) TaxID=358681 RepID=C0ZDY5_BREBN|nr:MULTISPECIES: GntR family transcriptional regulator [Brevibacillus]MBY0087408.1 GntR family transcriptional regulator [Brevibacillus brevis]MCC8436476.1 GntR family transcriptional regulator [Brevibacillus sp. M2.1A]MCM3140957.1 GntR family transcriptional regulator [Brevibacillus sp. MER 51]UKK98675.1 GntR family transcriptional regulator [Brevibacillus brevis]WJQ78959.1 GntR family transcriptional regulator [Brevibacillus brevis]